MPNRKYFNNIAALFALALCPSTALGAEEFAPKPIAKSERCLVCGMYPASYPKWHSQIVFKDGEHSSFDSQMDMFRFLHNMAKYDKHHGDKDIGRIFVRDYEKGGWLDANKAFFVSGSKAEGPMGADLPAFASKEDASKFTSKSGGEVFTFQQVTGAIVVKWFLVALTAIDVDPQLLPDDLTLPLLWLGLLASLAHHDGLAPPLPTDPQSAILGGAAGYLILWSVYWAFKLPTGKEGMGFGDFKLLAAIGAWLGRKMLPLVLLLSAFTGAVIGIVLIVARGRDRNVPIPFGPYLAAAGWIAMIWGPAIVGGYVRMTGLGG